MDLGNNSRYKSKETSYSNTPLPKTETCTLPIMPTSIGLYTMMS